MNNYNFNLCDYNQKIEPNNLYDFYNGFIRGNMFPDLYNEYKIKPTEIIPKNEKENLLMYIDAYSFATHDINLYLDNNPNDKELFNVFMFFNDQKNNLINEYNQKYGPLFVSDSSYPWNWINSPWPWEEK